MCENAERDLQQLDLIDRWRVVTYWRVLLWKRWWCSLPFPLKLGLVQWILLVAVMLSAPPVGELSPLFLPSMWMGTFAVSVTICMMLPTRRTAQSQ